MAFNLASFNNTAFNAGSDGVEAYVTAIGNERVLTDEMQAGNGVYISGSGTETIGEGVTTGMSSIVIRAEMSESVLEETTIMLEARPTAIGNEAVSYAITPGQQTMVKAKGLEEVTASAITDKETWLAVSFYELVSESATLEAVDLHVCELNVTLQPGQRMIVDAINYNVWIDGQNANWVQAGEWIDELTRETSSISVTASAGVSELTASILYTERYL